MSVMGASIRSVFHESIFFRRTAVPSASPYIRAMHPKSEILPRPELIRRILDSGWVGQLKIHGHRAQIHLSANEKDAVVVYNRQGKPHKKALDPKIIVELRRIFGPKRGWTVLDAEWLKGED